MSRTTKTTAASKDIALVTAYGEALKGAERAAHLSWPAFQAIASLASSGRSQRDIAAATHVSQASVQRALEIVALVDAGTLKAPRMVPATKAIQESLGIDEVTHPEDGASLLTLRTVIARKDERERLRKIETDAPLTASALVVAVRQPVKRPTQQSARQAPARTLETVVKMLAGQIVSASNTFEVDVDDIIAQVTERVDEVLNSETDEAVAA